MARAGQSVRTTCPYCGVGCGVIATVDENGGVTVAGDPKHPANGGRLCSKGNALADTIGLEGRLLHPLTRGRGGSMVRASWDKALDRVAGEFARAARKHGPDAVAFYLSGQLLTEDYYVANKLMKGFIGSANVDTNSRLCMASTVAGQRRAFGTDTVPGCYDDLDEAELIVLVGSNAAWCHPILFQRVRRARQTRGARVVVVDTRATATTDEADLFLRVEPGKDSVLFCGLLVDLVARGAIDQAFIDAHTSGFDATLAMAREIAPTLATTAAGTGIEPERLADFFDMFAATPRAVTLFSQGVNQSAQGTDKVNAIINCHLATGRIGKPGMGPLSLTGQPNAMGGREVGGLANQLAAHMTFAPEDVDRVGRFWNAPRMATREGLKTVDLFDAIGKGSIKALWVMGTNPAVSVPNADGVRQALGRLDFLVVSENVRFNDTVNSGADVLLPAAAWGERAGTVTNSERRISRQRAFLDPPGEAMPDWWIVTEVARRMGFSAAFAYRSPDDIFREHAALSAFENDGTRDFDIGAFARITARDYEKLAPVQWPARADAPDGRARLFGDGKFFHPGGKARFVPVARPALKTETSRDYPFRLDTGRIRDQWHTMTRSGRSPRLGQHLPEPYVEIHPVDAAASKLAPGGFARVESPLGHCELKVVTSENQPRGLVFAPIHWSGETASRARVGGLIAPHVDPHSGQPEAKAMPVAVTPLRYKLRGFVLSRKPLKMPRRAWWARVGVSEGYGYLFAANGVVSSWRDFFAKTSASQDVAEYRDDARRIYRAASFVDRRLELCVFIGRDDPQRSWNALRGSLAVGALSDDQRRILLAGVSLDGAADDSEIVCACYGVTTKSIQNVIDRYPEVTVAEIGERVRAGTGCGSCVPEIKRMITAARAVGAAKREAAE